MRTAASRRRVHRSATAPSASPGNRELHHAFDRASLILIGLATVSLGVFALGWHRVGDYSTESDFYSGYALGARALQHGRLDFGRYGVYGPVYELLLAVAGWVVRDLFVAARLLSVLAAGATMLAWWAIVRRRIDSIAALALLALLVVNPNFARYGYSATTDMVAVALFSLSAFACFAVRRPWAQALAGALAGTATLTRYNLITLLPAGVLYLAIDASRPPKARVSALLQFLGGALVVLLPWTLASLGAGHFPGETLVRDRGFYLGADPTETLEGRYRDLGASASSSPPTEVLRSWPALIVSLWHGILGHLRLDAIALVGPPATAPIVLGLVLLVARRRIRLLAPFLPLALLTFLALAPVFYTERYSLVLLPLYLLPAAWLIAAVAQAPWPRFARWAAAGALSLLVLVPTALWSVDWQRTGLAELPLEALAAGEAIRGRVRPGERMMARKGHAAYYAGLEPVAFPLVGSLATLAGYCRERDVRYLYYSGAEGRSRPAFGFLLDTSVVVPGLSPIYATTAPPCVVYRITAGFGETPAWWADQETRMRVAARVNALLQPGVESLPFSLGRDANTGHPSRP